MATAQGQPRAITDIPVEAGDGATVAAVPAVVAVLDVDAVDLGGATVFGLVADRKLGVAVQIGLVHRRVLVEPVRVQQQRCVERIVRWLPFQLGRATEVGDEVGVGAGAEVARRTQSVPALGLVRPGGAVGEVLAGVVVVVVRLHPALDAVARTLLIARYRNKAEFLVGTELVGEHHLGALAEMPQGLVVATGTALDIGLGRGVDTSHIGEHVLAGPVEGTAADDVDHAADRIRRLLCAEALVDVGAGADVAGNQLQVVHALTRATATHAGNRDAVDGGVVEVGLHATHRHVTGLTGILHGTQARRGHQALGQGLVAVAVHLVVDHRILDHRRGLLLVDHLMRSNHLHRAQGRRHHRFGLARLRRGRLRFVVCRRRINGDDVAIHHGVAQAGPCQQRVQRLLDGGTARHRTGHVHFTAARIQELHAGTARQLLQRARQRLRRDRRRNAGLEAIGSGRSRQRHAAGRQREDDRQVKRVAHHGSLEERKQQVPLRDSAAASPK